MKILYKDQSLKNIRKICKKNEKKKRKKFNKK